MTESNAQDIAPKPAEEPRGGPGGAERISPLRMALLVVGSVLLAALVLGAAGWLTANRLSPGEPAGGEMRRQPVGEAPPPFDLPEGSKPVPSSLTGQAVFFADVPGSRDEVAAFFTRQAQERGWSVAQQPAPRGAVSVTLVVEKQGWLRKIIIRRHPDGTHCTVGILDEGR